MKLLVNHLYNISILNNVPSVHSESQGAIFTPKYNEREMS